MARPLVLWRRPPELPDWFPEAVAVYPATLYGERRLVLVTAIEGKPVVYIAPPVPSPACTSRLTRLEVEVVTRVLSDLGARYTSACRVDLPVVYRETVSETLSQLVSLGILDCVGMECLGGG